MCLFLVAATLLSAVKRPAGEKLLVNHTLAAAGAGAIIPPGQVNHGTLGQSQPPPPMTCKFSIQFRRRSSEIKSPISISIPSRRFASQSAGERNSRRQLGLEAAANKEANFCPAQLFALFARHRTDAARLEAASEKQQQTQSAAIKVEDLTAIVAPRRRVKID